MRQTIWHPYAGDAPELQPFAGSVQLEAAEVLAVVYSVSARSRSLTANGLGQVLGLKCVRSVDARCFIRLLRAGTDRTAVCRSGVRSERGADPGRADGLGTAGS